MTEKELAKRFEQLRARYKENWLVADTTAFSDFCFSHSDEISKLLAKGAKLK